jgi:hypothetical protein
MNNRSFCWFGLIALLLTVSLGCGDNGATEEAPERFPDLPAAEPLDYTSDALGVGIHHGGTVQLEPGSAGNGVLQRTRAVASHAFLHVSVYDEFADTFGEYLYYRADSGATVRGPTYFSSNPEKARFESRAADLFNEVNAAMEAAGEDFATYSVVLDFWNVPATWYLPWDGVMDREPSDYGFFHSEMRQDLLDQITAVAETHKPNYFIVGTDMERLLISGASIYSEAEFSNFLFFFQDAVAAIHAVSPDTKVGAGINWDRFVAEVAPLYGADQETGSDQENEPDPASGEEGAPSNAQLDAAVEAVLLPLIDFGDILALKSYVTVDEAQPASYQFLRRLDDLYEVEKPLVWYSIGSPTTSASGYTQQRIYLERFAEWNAGLEPEMVAWRALMNIDGADAGTGQVVGNCRGLTGETNGFNLPIERCFDGLFASTLQPKPVFDALVEAVQ